MTLDAARGSIEKDYAAGLVGDEYGVIRLGRVRASGKQ